MADWIPDGIDLSRPSAARVYDYFLGGGHNFEVDRVFAERALAAHPFGRELAVINRTFVRRAVQFMLERGIRQFLDLGSGIPTVGNVHEIAGEGTRVVYVDCDDVAVAHTRLMLRDSDRATIVHADAARPDDVLGAPETRRMLDFGQPVGVLAATVFHYVSERQDPFGAAARYREAIMRGSYLAVSHLSSDGLPVRVGQMAELMKESQNNVHPRTRVEIARLFGDFEMVAPGLTGVAHWESERPTDAGRHEDVGLLLQAGIGRKP
ncbi:SAM-dependent methyltransferase [Allokutzneria albata]|uniref:S-adenosyl methyltransferase n=1 Tax=Allokutzneria albata TaxID=211114 RepID=A0A1G9T0E2_ALLAB|nr:SAM-dependent methyltransferase [Allokutzneria albata]SDM41179.1 S-adenosyl methyltransferase [Allokutzneria albata]